MDMMSLPFPKYVSSFVCSRLCPVNGMFPVFIIFFEVLYRDVICLKATLLNLKIFFLEKFAKKFDEEI